MIYRHGDTTTMEKSKLQEGLEQILETGYFNFSIQKYSGRGMGQQCLSITGDIDNGTLMRLGFALAQTDAFSGLGAIELPHARTDSMGRGIVVYWPSIEMTGADVCQAEG
jgi:hypothetical protein